MQLGSVEAGGTKFVCAVGNEDYRILDRVQFPTTTPEETLQKNRRLLQTISRITSDWGLKFWPNRITSECG